LCRREAAMVLPSADSHRGTQLSSPVWLSSTRDRPVLRRSLSRAVPGDKPSMKTF
jgi:hypothetical protein